MAPPTWVSPLLSIVGDPLHSASGDGAPALLTLSSAKMLLDRYLCCIRLQKCRIWTGTTYATFSACRTGRIAGAARKLGVNETTVARRIARVEGLLGFRMFERDAALPSPT